MNCPYCGSRTDEAEHRCRHCQRRLRPAAAQPASRGSAAPATQQEPAAATPPAVPPPAALARPHQPPLFSRQDLPNVIPFPAPPRPQPRSSGPRKPAGSNQPLLDLLGPAAHAPKRLKTSVESAVYSDFPIASQRSRAFAALLDAAMVVIGLSLFLSVFHLAGGRVVPTRGTMAVFAGVFAVLALFYNLFWCVLGRDTPGVAWMQMRVLNFDGHAPEVGERLVRLAAGCLSLLAAGLGLIWAIFDEEHLTWHDHISKTYLAAFRQPARRR